MRRLLLAIGGVLAAVLTAALLLPDPPLPRPPVRRPPAEARAPAPPVAEAPEEEPGEGPVAEPAADPPGDETVEEEVPAAPEGSGLPTTVLVLDAFGAPVPGAVLRPHLGWGRSAEVESRRRAAATDAAGRADMVVPEVDGRHRLVTGGAIPWDLVDVVGPLTVIRAAEALPLEVRVVDGMTGISLAAGAAVALLPEGAAPLPLPPRGDGFALPFSPAGPGRLARLRLRVDLPAGWVLAGGGTAEVEVEVSDRAAGVRLLLPAWREVPLTVACVDPGGAPVPGARLDAARESPPSAPPAGPDGLLEVRGLADVPGEVLRLEVQGPGGGTCGGPNRGSPGATESVALDGSGTPRLLRAVVGGEFRRLPAGDPYMCGYRHGCRFPEEPVVGAAALAVAVLRADGSPGTGARVTVRGVDGEGRFLWAKDTWTDGEGVAAFHGLPPGPFAVEAAEPGFIRGTAVGTLPPGGAIRSVVREGAARDLLLRVLDAAGNPAPGALVTVRDEEGEPVASLDGEGVQDLLPRTGPDGRLLLRRVPAAAVRVAARLGSRGGEPAVPEGAEEAVVVLEEGRVR